VTGLWFGVDETTVLIYVGIAGIVVAVVLFALSHALRARRAAGEVRATAEALLEELTRIRTEIDSRFPQFILSFGWSKPITPVLTPAFDQLSTTARIIDLGNQLAPKVNALYGIVEQINDRLRMVEAQAAKFGLRAGVQELVTETGENWGLVWSKKGDFLKQYPEVEKALRVVANRTE
jgi:hypothetical protein